jgi:hypothetical protein
MTRSFSRRQWWCCKITVLYVQSSRSCFARLVLDSFSWLPRGRLSSQYFFPTATSLTMVIHTFCSPVDKAARFLFPGILVLVLLPMLHDSLMATRGHVALVLQLKLKKNWENHYWYLQVYGLISMPLFFGCLQKSTRLCHGRRRV